MTKTGSAGAPAVQPPPLRPFGLVLHHDGRWTHEEHPILNRKMRELFDRSVVYLPTEDKFIVKLGHFRGEIEIEEAGFFVKAVDLAESQVHREVAGLATPAALRFGISMPKYISVCGAP